MGDTLERVEPLRLALRVVLLLAVLIGVPPLACSAIHELTHPAPLGRSSDAMLEHLDKNLPTGTTIDSAGRFFASQHLAIETPRSLDGYRSDPLFAGGPILIAIQPMITRGWYVWDGQMVLYFSPDGRLVHRDAFLNARNPL